MKGAYVDPLTGLAPPPQKGVLEHDPRLGIDEEPPWNRSVIQNIRDADQKRVDSETKMAKFIAKERRERIATAVLAGFAAWSEPGVQPYSSVVAASEAVDWADALIAELDK